MAETIDEQSVLEDIDVEVPLKADDTAVFSLRPGDTIIDLKIPQGIAKDTELLKLLHDYSIMIASAGPDRRLLDQCPEMPATSYIDDETTANTIACLSKQTKKLMTGWLKGQLRKGSARFEENAVHYARKVA